MVARMTREEIRQKARRMVWIGWALLAWTVGLFLFAVAEANLWLAIVGGVFSGVIAVNLRQNYRIYRGLR